MYPISFWRSAERYGDPFLPGIGPLLEEGAAPKRNSRASVDMVIFSSSCFSVKYPVMVFIIPRIEDNFHPKKFGI